MKKNPYFYSVILFFIGLSFTTNIFCSEKILVRFDNPDKHIIEKFIYGSYDVASYHPGEYLDLVINTSSYPELLKRYPKIKILKTEEQIKVNLHKEKNIPGYRSYSQTLTELQQIEIDNPDICKLYNIGSSQGKIYLENENSNYNDYNHDIWALKLSDNVEIEEDEPSFYFLGAHHAREPISTEVCMEILNNMLNNYKSDPDMQRRINNSQIWFVPIVNPDGQKVVLTEQDIWWRKNIRDNDFDLIFAGQPDGVDPNRNYGFWWGPNGTSEYPSSDVYKGTEPWSEPEIQAVKNLIESHHFIAGITYHSYSELVLYPFGYEVNAIPPDLNSLALLAENLASSIPSVYGGYYTPFQSVYLYPTMGTTDDYAYGEHGIFSFTIELANEFIPPYESALNICNNNLSAANILLDRVYTSTLTGVISDQVSKSPIVAEVFVESMDDSGAFREPYKSNEIFGRYYRLLEPGEYSVTYSAYGYIPLTIPNITISSSEITNLDISLTPATFRNISGYVNDFNTGSPIENARIEINSNISVIANTEGYFSFNSIPYGDNHFKVTSQNYKTMNTEIIIDETTSNLNFNLEQGNIEDFETHDFNLFNWITDESDFDWFISSYQPRYGRFYARSGILENEGTSTLILRDSLLENGNISFNLDLSNISSGDGFNFIIDDNIIQSWDTPSRWNEYSYPVNAGFHTFTWEFNKNTYTDSDVHASLDDITFPISLYTGIENGNNKNLVENCKLFQNYPNPFNPSTTIEFVLNISDKIKLNVYNVKGELIAKLLDKKLKDGNHKINFDGRNLNSGIYFISLETGDSKQVKSMLLLK